MKVDDVSFRSIWYDEEETAVKIIDQRWLPHDFRITTLKSRKDFATAIADMWVRGAPLIGATAAYAIAEEMAVNPSDENLNMAWIDLNQTRPTAINLRWALTRCKKTLEVIDATEAEEEDWSTEYLGPILSIKIVESLIEAVDHIQMYGSNHTDSIITEDQDAVAIFFKNVDSSSVMHNLPTCWADGFEYGLGAEVGISTDKIHARGPVGLEGLTSQKFIVIGNSQLRGI